MDTAVVVNSGNVFNFKPAIPWLERHAVNKPHQARYRVTSPKMGNIYTFDCSRGLLQLQYFLQSGETFLGINVKDLGVERGYPVRRADRVNSTFQFRRAT